MQTPFKLIVISPEHEHVRETETVAELFKAGLEGYHLRKPDWTVAQMSKWLSAIPAVWHKRIILHSHFELSNVFGVKGIHLNEESKRRATELGSYKIVSASFHAWLELSSNEFAYEYAFISPVFDSISKADHRSDFGLQEMEKELDQYKLKLNPIPQVIALGGVKAENVLLLKQAGFDGAAVLGTIWQSDEPVGAFTELLAVLK